MVFFCPASRNIPVSREQGLFIWRNEMAWLKSHQGLERHPKVLKLEELCSMDRNGTVGVLHRFWYWSMDYAEDGDLSKWSLETISKAIGIDANHLIEAGWIDKEPYLKVHDWFEYFGEYLRGKYRREPAKYEAIKKKCLGTDTVQNLSGTVVDKIRGEEKRRDKKRKDLPPNPLKGELVIPDDLLVSEPEIREWLEYKRQRGQSYVSKAGLSKLWNTFRSIPREKRRESVDQSMANNWAGLFEKKGGSNGQQGSYPKSKIGEPERVDSKFAGIVKTYKID